MPLLDIIILALIQGITEFLPVSSSGHLVIAHNVMDGEAAQSWDNHILLDVAVHVGTLLSILFYFHKDILKILNGLLGAVRGNIKNEGTKLSVFIIIGSIPVILAGLGIHILEPSWLLATQIVAWTTLIFGIALWIADRHGSKNTAPRDLNDMTLKDALIIGFAQTLALIPGTSRSGITMTAGRFLGFSRTECAHYSLLLGIVAISGAGTIAGLSMLDQKNLNIGLDIALAAGLSFISGLIAIALMMKWLSRASFTPFAVYRIILGVALLGLIYSGLLPT